MERAIELFALLNFLVMGLSHVLRPGAWVDFFILLREKGHAGVFVHGFLSLGFGALVLAFHNVWSGVPAVLSVVGVAYMVKALVCFLLPGLALRSLQRVSQERAWELMMAGVAYLAIGGSLCYSLWLT
jgi:uncharacterized protein YjeT (DUF2065 family)